MKLGEIIKSYREKHGVSQRRFATESGLSNSYISQLEKNKNSKNGRPITPSLVVLKQVADAMGIPLDDLLRRLDDMYISIDISEKARETRNPDIRYIGGRGIPLIGAIACGAPILAEENITEWIDIPSVVRADFALVCKGDSMTGARIMDGDLVCIRQQDDVTDGQIAAVLIDTEATLKRVYHNPDGTITLVAENPKYPPRIVGLDSTEDVRIIGLATHFISAVV